MRHPQRIGTAGNSFFLPTCDTSRISIGRNKQVAFMMQTRGGGWARHLNVIRLMEQVVIITCEQTPFQWNTTLTWGRPVRRLWSHCYCVTCRIKWRSKRGNGPSSLVVSAPMSVATLGPQSIATRTWYPIRRFRNTRIGFMTRYHLPANDPNEDRIQCAGLMANLLTSALIQ